MTTSTFVDAREALDKAVEMLRQAYLEVAQERDEAHRDIKRLQAENARVLDANERLQQERDRAVTLIREITAWLDCMPDMVDETLPRSIWPTEWLARARALTEGEK